MSMTHNSQANRRSKAAETSPEGEKELRQLVDAVPEHIVVLDGDARHLHANQVVLDYQGLTLEEFLVEESPIKCFHPDDLEKYRGLRQSGMTSKAPWQAEIRLRRKDGQYRWFLLRAKPLRDEQGRVVRWYLTGGDIEDLKVAERELQRETEIQAVFQKLVDSSMDGILAFDREGRYTVWNPALERIFGINELQRLGKKASDLCPFFRQTGGKNCYCDAIPGKGVVATDIPYTFAETGEQIFLDDHFSPLLDDSGNILGGLAIIRDVTERKRAEDALRRSESYLAEAQRLSHTGSFAHDPIRGDITYWSEESYRTFGFDPAMGPISFAEARSRVHPDDLQRFDECRERGIREKTGVEIDFRLLLPDRSIKHVHCISRPVVDPSGEVVELVGTNMDVTEQHQSRAALEKAFEEIKQLKDELYKENLALREEID